MPPTNRSKVQPQKITLSRHVKKLTVSSEVTTELSVSPKNVSAIPRRTRASAVLTDDLLLQIKKGLESSVASKSKPKVKRLSTTVKQVSKTRSSPKTSPARFHHKQSLQQVDETENAAAEKYAKVSKGAVNEKSRQQTAVTKERTSSEVFDSKSSELLLFKTPNIRQSRARSSVTQSFSSSKSSPVYEKAASKKSTKSNENSPTAVYSLRSRPEAPVSIMGPPSSQITAPRASRNRKRSLSPDVSVSESSIEKVSSSKVSRSSKRRSSGEALTESRINQRNSAQRDALTDTSSQANESSKRFQQVVHETEKLETPRKYSDFRKRKSESINNDEHVTSSKKPSIGATLTPSKLLVKVARIDNEKSVRSLVAKSPIGRNLLSEETVTPVQRVAVNRRTNESAKKSELQGLEADLHNFNSIRNQISTVEHTTLSQTRLARVSDTLEASVSRPTTSTVKHNIGVQWDTAAVKTRLIESIQPERRLTRSSYFSDATFDSTDFGAMSGKAEATLISEVSSPRSILKSSVNKYETNSSNSYVSTDEQVLHKPSSRSLCSRLFQILLLLGLPAAVAVYSYLALYVASQ